MNCPITFSNFFPDLEDVVVVEEWYVILRLSHKLFIRMYIEDNYL